MKLSFKFVDRDIQRRELTSYFIKNTFSEQGVWLSGPHNVGKTALINEVKKKVGGSYIHVNTNEYGYSYLVCFLAHISDSELFGSNSFLKCLSNRRPSVDSLLTQNYDRYHNLHIEKRLELAHYLYNEVYSKNIQSLNDDIQSFCLENDICGIIFDDFEDCDSQSLTVLQLFIAYIIDNHISLCFITDSDKKLNSTLSQFLFENLDVKDLHVDAFDDIFFYEEFINSCTSIPTNLFTSKQLGRIYDITKGNPGELKQFINNLRLKGAFNQSNLSNGKNIDSIISEVENSIYTIPENSYAKDILIILYIHQTPVKLQLLLALIREIYRPTVNVNSLLIDKLIDLIDTMKSEGILVINDDQTISFATKSIKQHIYESIASKDTARFYFITYSLLELDDKKWFCTNGYEEIVIKRIVALCKYILQFHGFVKYNSDLAQLLFTNGYHNEAVGILERIKDYISQLDANEIILLTNYLYNIGEYKLALLYINAVVLDQLSMEEKVEYYIIQGKIKFILLDPKCATDFENARFINNTLNNISTKTEIDNLLFMAYSENKHTLSEAKNVFVTAIQCKSDCISYAKLCRNAHNVLTYDEALPIMLTGLAIAKECGDGFEITKSLHNIAFIKLMYIKDISNLDSLKSEFIHASQFFQQNNAAHESAYSLNNYAVILMLQENWNDANNYLRKARVLANSQYALYVINCNLLLVNCFPENMDHSEMQEMLQKQYYKIINSDIVDNRIMRKHLINFAVISLRYNDYDAAKFYLNECRPFLLESPSIARFNLLCKRVNEPICTNKHDIGNAIQYYRDLPFEPWILSFGHD